MGNNLMQTDLSVWGMYQHADIVVKCVMIGLILASVVTRLSSSVKALNFSRKAPLKARTTAISRCALFRSGFRHCGRFQHKSLSAQLINEAQNELELSQGSEDNEGIKERTGFRLERRVAAVGRYMGRGNGYLATIGAISPSSGCLAPYGAL